MEDIAAESNSNNLTITNIKWKNSNNVKSSLKEKSLPTEIQLGIPAFLASKNLDSQNVRDEIETFAYSFLNKKYGAECTSCQIFLPLKESADNN